MAWMSDEKNSIFLSSYNQTRVPQAYLKQPNLSKSEIVIFELFFDLIQK
jgi:hypothetical protein